MNINYILYVAKIIKHVCMQRKILTSTITSYLSMRFVLVANVTKKLNSVSQSEEAPCHSKRWIIKQWHMIFRTTGLWFWITYRGCTRVRAVRFWGNTCACKHSEWTRFAIHQHFGLSWQKLFLWFLQTLQINTFKDIKPFLFIIHNFLPTSVNIM